MVEGESDAPGVDSLRRVLTAFAWRNPEVGYCQSMNILGANFLLYMPEGEAFWLLCTVCENIVPHYYTQELIGSQVDQFVFNSLVEHNLPLIDAKLKEINLPLELLTLPWFMCLFVTYIPWAASLR
jgi:TBC1 domain family member 8/9